MNRIVVAAAVAGLLAVSSPAVAKRMSVVTHRVTAATLEAVTGDAGLRAMNALCQEMLANPEARMCTSAEVVASPNLSVITGYGGWVQPVIGGAVASEGGDLLVIDAVSGTSAVTLNCNNWSATTGTGLVWSNSRLTTNPCTTVRRVICCLPTIVTIEQRR